MPCVFPQYSSFSGGPYRLLSGVYDGVAALAWGSCEANGVSRVGDPADYQVWIHKSVNYRHDAIPHLPH